MLSYAMLPLAILLLALPSQGQAQVEVLSGEELYIDRLGCWNCHGMTGGGGAGPAIAGTELSLRTFAAYLRLPSGEMPRVSARLASDGDLAILYRWLDGVEAPSTPLPVELSLEASSAGDAQSEVTLTAQAAETSVGSGLSGDGELRYRVTLQTMVPWVREKTPVANQTVEFQLPGQASWSVFTTDARGEALLGADQGFRMTLADRATEQSALRLRTALPSGRHTLVVEALDGSDAAGPTVVGMGTAVLRGNVEPVDDLPNPYRSIENHFKLAEGRWWGSTSAVDIDIDGQSIWVAERCAGNSCAGSRLNPILHFDAAGRLQRRFGEGLFILPTGIHVDREGNVWVTDAEGPDGKDSDRDGKGHAVYKFSPSGRLLLTLGTPGVVGDGAGALLSVPNDVVTAPNGDVFVADGAGRIVKYTKNGTFIEAFGREGSAPGELLRPSGLALDSEGRLFVADSGNDRVQIFDQQGRFFDAWPQFGGASGIFIDGGGLLYAAAPRAAESSEGRGGGILIGSVQDGSVRYFIPASGAGAEGMDRLTGVAADASGTVFAAMVDPEIPPRALMMYVR